MADFPLLVVALVFALTAVRRVGRLRLAIWQITLLGAAAVMVSGHTSPSQALAAIDFEVLLFLFGVFVLGEALVRSGYLFRISHRLFSRLPSARALLAAFVLVAGAGSAILMNDTLAIVGTPLALRLAREHRLPPKMLLLALAFGVTTGSVVSPIGNPQNLLVALSGAITAPFATFAAELWAPTLINLLLTLLVLRLAYRGDFSPAPLRHGAVQVSDPALAALARAGLLLLIAGIIALAVWGRFGAAPPLVSVALLGAAPLLLLSRRRLEIVRHIDWHTLIFFAALFVLMDAVWRSEGTQALLALWGGPFDAVPVVLSLSLALSQLISNVPLVTLYLPLLEGAPEAALLALAAGSTLAGNALLLGAASNIIIVQAAERRGESLSFFEFARVGIPLTLLQAGVLLLFLG